MGTGTLIALVAVGFVCALLVMGLVAGTKKPEMHRDPGSHREAHPPRPRKPATTYHMIAHSEERAGRVLIFESYAMETFLAPPNYACLHYSRS